MSNFVEFNTKIGDVIKNKMLGIFQYDGKYFYVTPNGIEVYSDAIMPNYFLYRYDYTPEDMEMATCDLVDSITKMKTYQVVEYYTDNSVKTTSVKERSRKALVKKIKNKSVGYDWKEKVLQNETILSDYQYPHPIQVWKIAVVDSYKMEQSKR